MRSYSGKFTPIHPDKYLGDSKGIIYRSLLERRLMVFCDMNPDVVEWASEEFHIQYVNPLDRSVHRYFPDFFMKVRKKDGTFEKIVVEVKPFSQCFQPKPPKKQSPRFIKECETFIINQAKWNAAKEFCKKHDFKFQVLTERELSPKK